MSPCVQLQVVVTMASMSEKPYTVSVVCTGNICRSPIGEVVLQEAFKTAGLANQVQVNSAGTGSWHLGDGADHRAEEVLTGTGLTLREHQARQFNVGDFAHTDLVLALDYSHYNDLRRLAPTEEDTRKIQLIRSFDPDSDSDDDLEVADPYYGDIRDFEIALEQIKAATPGIVEFVQGQLEQ